MFVSSRDAEITLGIYRRVPVLWRDGDSAGNPWDLSFLRMLDMATDSKWFMTGERAESQGWVRSGTYYRRDDQQLVPLYEAKLIHQFDHRLACYSKRSSGSQDTELPRLTAAEKRDPSRVPVPRYWVPKSLVDEKLAEDPKRGRPCWSADWLLGWRDITNATNERTVIASLLPRVGVGHTAPLFISPLTSDLACLLGNFSAFCVDYVVRQGLSGIHLTYTVLKQIPILPPVEYSRGIPWDLHGGPLRYWIVSRVLELCYTSHDLKGFARDYGDHGPPFIWDNTRRELLRAELDAAYFHLYGVKRDDVDYIMDTFNGVRGHDEKAHGEYRTKRLILEIYDAMREAMDTGGSYTTVLDPPPGQGARHPAREEAQA